MAISVGEGVGFGVGGTNYRVARCTPDGEVKDVEIIPTPNNPHEFFRKTTRSVLEAADQGAEWAVLGVPGPVTLKTNQDGRLQQHFKVTNIPALNAGFDPIAEMTAADPAFERLLGNGFVYLTQNDGDLAAQAAAHLYGSPSQEGGRPDVVEQQLETTRKEGKQGDYDVVADLIDGTGTGGAVARRDHRLPKQNIFHPDPGLWEVGHIPVMPGALSRTHEKAWAGPGLESHCGVPTDKLDENDPVWKELAHGLGNLTLTFALTGGADLAVISGGVGIHGQDNYKGELARSLEDFRGSRNPMADRVPDVQYVPPELADTYELYGAHGAVVSHLTRRAIDDLVRTHL